MPPVAVLLFALTVLGAAGLIAQLLWLGSLGRPGPALTKDEMRRHLVWGLFYVNPDDPRGWVPKVYGIGWTVNMRTPGQAKLMAALIVLTLVFALAMSAVGATALQ
jgi:uncharacterized membrane protein